MPHRAVCATTLEQPSERHTPAITPGPRQPARPNGTRAPIALDTRLSLLRAPPLIVLARWGGGVGEGSGARGCGKGGGWEGKREGERVAEEGEAEGARVARQ